MKEGMFSLPHCMDSQKIHTLTIQDMLMKLVREMEPVVTSIFQCPQEPDMKLGLRLWRRRYFKFKSSGLRH